VSEERLQKLLKDKQVIAVICNQFGDTGKGKFSDFFASHWADVIARGTGGNNAGHTVKFNGNELIFHLLPSGISEDKNGKINILGNGMVIDPIELCKEMDELESLGHSYKYLMISKDAHVIMPYHISQDKAKNQSLKNGGIGSTGRGIGPCYTDKIARRGIKISDLFNTEELKQKINKAKEFYPNQEIDENKIIEELQPYIQKIKPFVKDTIAEIHKLKEQGKKICLEGAQGLFLSVEYGTYPYVTSSDPSINGTAAGVGLSAADVDTTFGVIKFPFMTRVGGGPFPTELAGQEGEKHCSAGLEHDFFFEAKEFLQAPINLEEIRELQKQKDKLALEEKEKEIFQFIKENPEKVIELIDSKDELKQAIGIRLAAFEYGATTKRPRRTGWTDAILAKHARKINGPHFILTKVDSLAGAEKFGICYGHTNTEIKFSEFNNDSSFLREANPEIKFYSGYKDISKVREFDQLPESLKQAIKEFEEFTQGKVDIISVGPDREETIIC
jgi:adenylosuccinate synthase